MAWRAGDMPNVDSAEGAYFRGRDREDTKLDTMLPSGEEIEGEAEIGASKEKAKSFLGDQEDFGDALDEAFPRTEGFRGFIAKIPAGILLFVGPALSLFGASVVASGAIKTGGSMGAGAPVGVPVMVLGLGVLSIGVSATVLGIVKLAQKRRFFSEVDKSHLPDEMKQEFKDNYGDLTPRDSKMRLLAAKIRADEHLSPEAKEDLLSPYIGEEVKRGAPKELRSRYEFELLKAHFGDVEGMEDVNADNFEEYYREARKIAGQDPMKDDIAGDTKAERKQALKDFQENNKLDHRFFKRLDSIRRKVDREESRAQRRFEVLE